MALEPSDVLLIMDLELPELTVQAYLDDAGVYAGSLNITSEVVIKYLTAHMIATTQDRPVKSQEAGGAKVVYEGVFGSGLLSTTYGQTAIVLDTTDKLLGVAKGKIEMAIRAIKS